MKYSKRGSLGMKRVVAYCRVSTKSDDQQNSYENQKHYFEHYINECESYENIGIYADRGISGTSLKRPQFNKMLTDAGLDTENSYSIVAEPKFDLILVSNTSRFARNVSVDVILKALASNHVYVHFLDLDKTTENPDDITYIQLFSVFDERESRDKSRKVLFGIEQGIKNGNIHSHGNIYGYKYYPKPENRLEIVEHEAEIVRLIFDLYVNQGLGLYRIANYLKQSGIKTKKGKDFSDRGIRLILSNITYTGCGVRKKYTEGLVFEKHARRETDEPVVFDTDKVPAIIDRELYDKAQQILQGRIQHQRQKGIYSGKTDYAGKIICGSCGNKYIAGNSDYLISEGRNVRCYSCASKRERRYDENGNKIYPCSNPNIYETVLDSQVTGAVYIFRTLTQVVNAMELLKKLRGILESQIDTRDDKAIISAQSELEEAKARRERLLDLYEDAAFDKDELNSRVEPINDRITELRERIKALSKTNDDLRRDIGEINNTIALLSEQKKLRENEWGVARKMYSKEAVLSDIESITVRPNKTLVVKYKSFEQINRLVRKHRHLIPDSLMTLFQNYL